MYISPGVLEKKCRYSYHVTSASLMEYFGPSNTKVKVQLSPSAHARAGREFFFFRGKIDERKALQRALAKFNEHRRAYKALEVGMLSPMQGGGGGVLHYCVFHNG